MSKWRIIISLQHLIIMALITIIMNSTIIRISIRILRKMSFLWRNCRVTRFSNSKISMIILMKFYQVNLISNKRDHSQRHLLTMVTMDSWVLKKMIMKWIRTSKVTTNKKLNCWIRRNSSRQLIKLQWLVKIVIFWMTLLQCVGRIKFHLKMMMKLLQWIKTKLSNNLNKLIIKKSKITEYPAHNMTNQLG